MASEVNLEVIIGEHYVGPWAGETLCRCCGEPFPCEKRVLAEGLRKWRAIAEHRQRRIDRLVAAFPGGYADAVADVEAAEPHPCGHVAVTKGCGGCDPGAIEFVINDGSRTPRPPVPSDFMPRLPGSWVDREALDQAAAEVEARRRAEGRDLPLPDPPVSRVLDGNDGWRDAECGVETVNEFGRTLRCARPPHDGPRHLDLTDGVLTSWTDASDDGRV